jgi:hypothetical protein
VVLLALFHVSATVPNPVSKANSFAITVRPWPSWKRGASGRFQDIGQVPARNFDWLPFTPLWSPSPVLQLVSEPIWSLVGFNMLCDLKKVLLSLWFSMARISVTEKTELATIS